MGAVGKFLLSPVAALAGMMKPKTPEIPAQQPQAVDRSSTVILDAVASRTGSLANRRTGSGGAEASGGKKTSLGG